jgi:hypothetical protein
MELKAHYSATDDNSGHLIRASRHSGSDPLDESPLVDRDDHAMDGGRRGAEERFEVTLRRRASVQARGLIKLRGDACWRAPL